MSLLTEFGNQGPEENITLDTVDIETHALQVQPIVIDEDTLTTTLENLQTKDAQIIERGSTEYKCVSCQQNTSGSFKCNECNNYCHMVPFCSTKCQIEGVNLKARNIL